MLMTLMTIIERDDGNNINICRVFPAQLTDISSGNNREDVSESRNGRQQQQSMSKCPNSNAEGILYL